MRLRELGVGRRDRHHALEVDRRLVELADAGELGAGIEVAHRGLGALRVGSRRGVERLARLLVVAGRLQGVVARPQAPRVARFQSQIAVGGGEGRRRSAWARGRPRRALPAPRRGRGWGRRLLEVGEGGRHVAAARGGDRLVVGGDRLVAAGELGERLRDLSGLGGDRRVHPNWPTNGTTSPSSTTSRPASTRRPPAAPSAPTPQILDFYSRVTGRALPEVRAVDRRRLHVGRDGEHLGHHPDLAHPAPGARRPRLPSEGLVAHEAAHQWFGDLLTCEDWSHAWLNEGSPTTSALYRGRPRMARTRWTPRWTTCGAAISARRRSTSGRS